MGEIGQAINSITTRNDLADFLNDPENAQIINILVEDIRYALMDYQVCTSEPVSLIASNIYLRLHYNRTSTIRIVKRL